MCEPPDLIGVGVDSQSPGWTTALWGPPPRMDRDVGAGLDVGEAGVGEGGSELFGVSGPDVRSRGGQQLGLGAGGDDPAVADDDEVVGDDFDLVEQVGGQQHSGAAVRVATEQVAHPSDAGRV